jgi:hypothetical protein
VPEHPFDAAQVGDATADLRKPRAGDASDGAPVGAVVELEECCDLLKRESQVLRALDETDAVHVARAVTAVSASHAAGLRHQAAPFVIAHRFYTDARGFGDVPDRMACLLHKHSLDSVPRYGLYTPPVSLSRLSRTA